MTIEQSAAELNQEIEIDYWDLKQNKIDTVKKKMSNPLAKDVKASNASYTLLNLTNKKEAEAMIQHFETTQTLSAMKGAIEIVGNASVNLMQKLTLKNFPKR